MVDKIIVFTIYLTTISVSCMICSCAPAECVLHSDCAPGNVCVDNRCFIDCSTERDCPDGYYCIDGACLPGECYKGVCNEGYDMSYSEYETTDIDDYQSDFSDEVFKISNEKFSGGDKDIGMEIPEFEDEIDDGDDAFKISDEEFSGGDRDIEVELPESEDETDDALKISDEKFSGREKGLKIEASESEDETDEIMNYNHDEDQGGELSIYKSLNCFASADFETEFDFRTGGQE